MSTFVDRRRLTPNLRIPLEATLDLTYRCNNRCRHCWLRTSACAKDGTNELTYDEITQIVDRARKMGCRKWRIFGGEPMIRTDFPGIFDYITRNSATYTLNTNGTLITPEIARLMTRKGVKLVAVYGATAEVHDHITRNPGSFDATMQGFAYLKEAGAGFTVQIVPMKDNYHQYHQMVDLANTLSPHWRVGASWLYFTACGDEARNREIRRQRLSPAEVINIESPEVIDGGGREEDEEHCHQREPGDDRVFASCIERKRDFHIDPYGTMSFCDRAKHPALRYDLREGSLQECWDEFIPSLADKVRGGQEYLENCGGCKLRGYCFWCPVYGYLEHRRLSAKVEYLCEVAQRNREHQENYLRHHIRYYRLAGVTIRVESDIPIADGTYHPKLRLFEVGEPGEDRFTITHHFSLPDVGREPGTLVYRRPPWAVFRKNKAWVYRRPAEDDQPVEQICVLNDDHTRAVLYHNGDSLFRNGGLESLAGLPTDQVMLAWAFASRHACYFHSAGANLDGKGILFLGQSTAGKSTIAKLLHGNAEVLCDERLIMRRWPDGFWIHGSWSHGEVPIVSPNSAPLKAFCFLNKSAENRLELIPDKREVSHRLLPRLVKPLQTKEWWEKILPILNEAVDSVPAYQLYFDMSRRVIDVLRKL